jgi:adenylate kinase family enzyme
MARRLHITGASGSGTTSLGAALAKTLGCHHLDTDDFYWLPTDPPFRTKWHASERLSLLNSALAGKAGFVLSGSLDGWGDPLIPLFTAVIFLETPTSIRLSRLQGREAQHYGDEAIAP